MLEREQKIIFVDYYGILSNTRFWYSIQNPEHKLHKFLPGIQDFLFVRKRNILDDWMRGKYTSEEIHHILAKEFSIDFGEWFKIFVEDCKTIELSQKILDKLDSLPENHLKIMVTDNMDSFDRFILPANKILEEIFHEINNSFHVQKLKADKNGEWFLDILSKYDIPIKNCVLIDDSERNCETFQKLGGKYYNSKTENEVLEALDNLF